MILIFSVHFGKWEPNSLWTSRDRKEAKKARRARTSSDPWDWEGHPW